MLNSIPGFWRIKRFKRNLPQLLELMWMEVHYSADVSLLTKIACFKKGFFSVSHLIYDLKNNPGNYLSDYAWIVGTAHINNKFKSVLSNKLIFHSVLGQFPEFKPKIYAVIRNRVMLLLPEAETNKKYLKLSELVTMFKTIVAKPISGGGGSDIYIIKYQNDVFFINGKPVSQCDLDTMVAGKLNSSLLEEYIEQANYSASIFSGSSNTIRLLTMWDYEENKPFIAAATHRFGTEASAPVDNWSQGGVVARVDLQTGSLSQMKNNSLHETLDQHPDSNKSLKGVSIPHWLKVKEKMLEISSHFPFIPYIGWDILIDKNDNLKIIEGNHRSGIDILQIYYPLLKDERVKKFYQYHNVLP